MVSTSACVYDSFLQNVQFWAVTKPISQFKSWQGTLPSGHSDQVVQTASWETSLLKTSGRVYQKKRQLVRVVFGCEQVFLLYWTTPKPCAFSSAYTHPILDHIYSLTAGGNHSFLSACVLYQLANLAIIIDKDLPYFIVYLA